MGSLEMGWGVWNVVYWLLIRKPDLAGSRASYSIL